MSEPTPAPSAPLEPTVLCPTCRNGVLNHVAEERAIRARAAVVAFLERRIAELEAEWRQWQRLYDDIGGDASWLARDLAAPIEAHRRIERDLLVLRAELAALRTPEEA